MKNYHSIVFRKSMRAALFAVASLPLIAGIGAFGQTAAAGNGEEKTQQLEKFVVTGSYIPYAGDAPATEVQVLTAADIAKTGVTGDLLEVLRKAAPQFIGNGNLGSTNSNIAAGSTNGGSALFLRNTATLVLVNGRRAAFAPVSATGGFTFVDVNAIPVSAVERVEIVTDGASALYGADAVSGVVNIILKKEFDGVQLGGTYKFSTDKAHSWQERNVNFTVGAHTDKTSVVVSGEWVKTDPIFQASRKASSPSFGTPTFAGVVQIGGTSTGKYFLLAPGLNAPPLNTDLTADQLVAQGIYTVNPATHLPYTFTEIQQIFDLSKAVTLIMGSSKKILTMNLEHKLGEKSTFFSEASYAQNTNFSQLNAQPLTDVALQTHVASDPRNPFNIQVRARNRFTDFPRVYLNDTNAVHYLGGFRGKLSDTINWEVAYNHNQIDQLYRNPNVINTANLNAAKAAGTINMFAIKQAPGAIEAAQIFGTAFVTNVSRLNSIDARISGELPIELPGGPLQFALGGEVRHEGLSAAPDAGSLPDQFGTPVVWTTATTFAFFNANRNIKSVFAETRVPIFSPKQNVSGFNTVDLDIAARRDSYSDGESPTVPKFMLRWLPFNDELVFRASFSKSFIAPTLFQNNGPDTFGVTGGNNITPFGGGAKVSLGQIAAVGRSNPHLSPQHSDMKNFGFVYSPRKVKGLSFEVSYFNLTLKDIVGGFPSNLILQDVENKGAASPFAKFVAFGAFAGTPGSSPVTAPGQMTNPPDDLYLIGLTVNIAKQTQSGFDFVTKYDFKVENLGQFNFQLSGTRYSSYKTFIQGSDPIESVGKNEATNGTIPQWLANSTLDLTRGDMSFGLGFQYIGAVNEVIEPDIVGHQSSYISTDIRASYRFNTGLLKGLTLRAGANNVFDKAPPLSTTVNGGTNFDANTYTASVLGRVVYISGSYKF